MTVPLGDQKERGASAFLLNAAAAPESVSGESSVIVHSAWRPGKATAGEDPQARRPAVSRKSRACASRAGFPGVDAKVRLFCNPRLGRSGMRAARKAAVTGFFRLRGVALCLSTTAVARAAGCLYSAVFSPIHPFWRSARSLRSAPPPPKRRRSARNQIVDQPTAKQPLAKQPVVRPPAVKRPAGTSCRKSA